MLTACTKEPFEAGKALGERHAAQVEEGEIKFETLMAEVKEAREPYAKEAAAAEKFKKGYSEGVRPVSAKLVAMAIAEGGTDAGEALGLMVDGIGAGIGGAVDGFMRSITGGDEGKDDTEALRDLGRKMGKALKKVGEGAEAVAEGIEEELDN